MVFEGILIAAHSERDVPNLVTSNLSAFDASNEDERELRTKPKIVPNKREVMRIKKNSESTLAHGMQEEKTRLLVNHNLLC